MKYFGHLCLQNYYFGTSLKLYDQSVKSWEFRIREIRYCWEGNTMLLRRKYDVLINVTWDCFDQSNFYISRINFIEWNNMIYVLFINPFLPGESWPWSYGSWIYNYICNQCLPPQWLTTARWFSPGPPISSTNKTDRHDITEILLKWR